MNNGKMEHKIMKNQDIRDLLKSKRMYYRELAAALYISNMTLYRWLNSELPAYRKAEILEIINNFKIE